MSDCKSQTTLLPCPFCGGTPTLDEIPPHSHSFAKFMPDHPGSWTVECSCGCGLLDETRNAVVTRWNQRNARNARLIAAAPDLAQTLADIVETFRARPDIWKLCGPHEERQVYAACRALAKAEWRSA